MKVHADEKEIYKKKIEKFKDECVKKNKEIQRERQKKKERK